MACLIKCKTGMDCSCFEVNGDALRQEWVQPEGRNLVLLDCQGLSLEELRSKIQKVAATLPPIFSMALYNMRKDSGLETGALGLGVRGFFYEDDSAECLAKGVNNIVEGDLWVSRKKMVECLLSRKAVEGREIHRKSVLSRREKDIIRHITNGETNDEIARSLCISSHTVRTHIYNIFKKIHVSNRLQASRWAEQNLLD
jgi:LuxR family transcriptional regulator of csgAB operon